MLSAVVFGGMGAGMMMDPKMSSPESLAPNTGTSMALTDANLEPTYPVVGGQAPAFLLPARAKEERPFLIPKRRIPQEESLMLYRMVQSTADKLTGRFKSYSKVMRELASSEANRYLIT